MADIPVFRTEEEGTPQYQPASAGGDTFENDGQTYLELIGPLTEWSISVETQRDCQYGNHPNAVKTSPAGENYLRTNRYSPFRFNDKSGRAHVTYPDGAVGIQIRAIRHHEELKDEG